MFQDISPKKFDNHYSNKRAPKDNDYVMIYSRNRALFTPAMKFPQVKDVNDEWHFNNEDYTYLFSIDETGFFLIEENISAGGEWQYQNIQSFQTYIPSWLGFAGATAAQLGEWYSTNKFCGRCGWEMKKDDKERELRCEHCHRSVFPKIAPAIIVGVTNGDQLLLTKFLTGYDRYALISGYAEVGETIEDTVRREIREEVGLEVHNIRYYASQPWAFSGSLLAGYFADLDEDKPIKLERDELSKAKWFKREDLPRDDSARSMTWEMINKFRNHEI